MTNSLGFHVYKDLPSLISITNPFQPEHWPALHSALPLPVIEAYPLSTISFNRKRITIYNERLIS
jgi:hypothetical protein